MGTKFNGGTPWAAITEVIRTPGPRSAAIAYAGEMAPDLLPLQRGDVLVVNASDSALLSHATHPGALDRFCKRGVRVYVHPDLHAKVLATSTHAVIGSANASRSSTGLAEAAVISDAKALVADVKAFVESLVSESTAKVSQAWIERSWKIFDSGRGGGPPGTDGATKRAFPSRRDGKILLIQPEDARETKTIQKVTAATRRAARRRAGRASEFEVDRITDRVRDEADALHAGDILIENLDGALWLVEIDSEPIAAGRSTVINWRCWSTSLAPIPVAQAEAALRAQGVRIDFDAPERKITNRRQREALLNLWPTVEGN